MNHRLRFTAEKIAKRLDLIRPHIHRRRAPIAPFRMRVLPDAAFEPHLCEDPSGWPEIPWDSYWAGSDVNFLLKSRFTVPEDWDGPIALHLPMGVSGDIFTHPEALVHIDNEPIASADRHHHTILLDPALADGRSHLLALHGWTGLSGWPPDPDSKARLFMRECAVVEIDPPLETFVALAETALGAARHLDEARPERHAILNALDAAFAALDARDPLPAGLYGTVARAHAALEHGLARAGGPMPVDLHAIGHAHMDIAYLWPISQIRRKNARTTSNVLRLMERHPQFRFAHSQPQLYQYTEQDYPALFGRIADRVAEGRWELIGGMWVEPDLSIPGGEALVRQILLGRRYFREKFGDAETPVLWLPDTFGFPASLPQLMEKSGLRWFVSNKMSWNQYNKLPFSSCWWQGIDGTRVLAQFLTTPRPVAHLPFPTNYKSDLTPEEVFGTWENSASKDRVSTLPICYGYGDGGGGPTDDLVRRLDAWGKVPGAPRIRQSTVRAFFEDLEDTAHSLPTWAGELYLEGHRGTLTSQGWIKRANRKAEVALHDAEFLAAYAEANGVPVACGLHDAWELLCLNQFHDILTGTSIAEVFDDARRDYDQIAATTDRVRDAALEAIGGNAPVGATHMAVSTIGFAMTRQAFVPGAGPTPVGSAMRSQAVDGGTLVELPDMAGYSVTFVGPGGTANQGTDTVRVATSADGSIVLENDLLSLSLSPNGDVIDIFDKTRDRAVLPPGAIGNQLIAFEDRPLNWDAWDIDVFVDENPEPVDGFEALEITERGPLRGAVRISRRYRQSMITQTIRLRAHSKRIDFVTDIDWHETHTLLRAAFPVAVHSARATFEIQWGVFERPTHANTSWDYAKFETPGQKWADLSEGDYGVALLNDCKYGYQVRNDTLQLSLIKSATMPDPNADQGSHRFTYALLPHADDWTKTVPAAAYDLNYPVIVAPVAAGTEGNVPIAQTPTSFVRCDRPNITIETIKPAEDGKGFIVRLFEAQGCRGPVTLSFMAPLAAVRRCSPLENDEAELELCDNSVRFDIAPFKIITLRCICLA